MRDIDASTRPPYGRVNGPQPPTTECTEHWRARLTAWLPRRSPPATRSAARLEAAGLRKRAEEALRDSERSEERGPPPPGGIGETMRVPRTRAVSSRRQRHGDAGGTLDLGEMTANALAGPLAGKARSDAGAIAQFEANFPNVAGFTETPYQRQAGRHR